MNKIESFKINHLLLNPGLYVSRKDVINNTTLITFDLRICKPNVDHVMDTGTCHTIEHIAATYLRNNAEWKNKTIYFGPMGCRTGFYLIFAGDLNPFDIQNIMIDLFTYIESFNDDIPGATPRDCGNYSDMNLDEAKKVAKKYLRDVLNKLNINNTTYPN